MAGKICELKQALSLTDPRGDLNTANWQRKNVRFLQTLYGASLVSSVFFLLTLRCSSARTGWASASISRPGGMPSSNANLAKTANLTIFHRAGMLAGSCVHLPKTAFSLTTTRKHSTEAAKIVATVTNLATPATETAQAFSLQLRLL